MQIDPTVYVELPTGSYAATIQSLAAKDGTYGPELEWIFDLGEVEDVEENVEQRTMKGFTSQVLSANSKLWKWSLAAGLDPESGIDTDDLIGRKVVLELVVEPKKDGTGNWNKIFAVSKPKSKVKKAVAQVPDDDDGSEL